LAAVEPHILLVGGDGHPSGVPRNITDIATALAGRARITVISEADAGGYSTLGALGARHMVVPGLASRLNPAAVREGRKGLLHALRSEAADIVWFHARLPVILGRQLLCTGQWVPEPGTRIAVTYHGLPFGPGHRSAISALSLRNEKRLLDCCPPLDLVFLTQAQADAMAGRMRGRIDRHRLHVLGNASHIGDLPKLTERRPGRHLVMTGRTGWQKNYDAALRLMRDLPPDVTLSLCGFGTDRDRFKARARKLAGAAVARIEFLGPLPDVRPLLAKADGYMLLSRYEGLPIGALEACECGLPMILADFDGADHLVDGHPLAVKLTGTDRAAHAAAVDEMLTTYLEQRATITEDIRRFWAQRWSPDRFAGQLLKLVQAWQGTT